MTVDTPFFEIESYTLPVDNNSHYPLDELSNDIALLVVSQESIADTEKQLLEKIIAATKIDPSARADIKYKEGVPLAIGRLIRTHNIKNVISFGVQPIELGLKMPAIKYKSFFLEHALIIFADEISKLLSNKESKGLLWTRIKADLIPRL